MTTSDNTRSQRLDPYQSRDGRDVAISDGFQGDGCAGWELREKGLNGASRVVDPGSLEALALRVED